MRTKIASTIPHPDFYLKKNDCVSYKNDSKIFQVGADDKC